MTSYRGLCQAWSQNPPSISTTLIMKRIIEVDFKRPQKTYNDEKVGVRLFLEEIKTVLREEAYCNKTPERVYYDLVNFANNLSNEYTDKLEAYFRREYKGEHDKTKFPMETRARLQTRLFSVILSLLKQEWAYIHQFSANIKYQMKGELQQ